MDSRKTFRLILVLVTIFVVVFFVARKLNPPVSENSTLAEGDLVVTPIKAEDLTSVLKKKGARLSVVNFWATFCDPCREEFPYFVKARQKYQKDGVEVFFVSLDFASEMGEVRKFLAEQRVDFETYIKNQPDGEFIDGIHKEWSGAIPITLLYDEKARLIEFIPKALTFEELDEKISKVLKSDHKPSK